MRLPNIVGVKLKGSLQKGVTGTDLVLAMTNFLRDEGVVGAYLEFFGEGANSLSVGDRASISNMTPEYGATAAMFYIDEQTLAYLRLTGRSDAQVALVEAMQKPWLVGRCHGYGRIRTVPQFDLSNVGVILGRLALAKVITDDLTERALPILNCLPKLVVNQQRQKIPDGANYRSHHQLHQHQPARLPPA